MKKKLTLLLITALTGLMVLTACGSSENTEQPGTNVSDEKQQEEIPAIGDQSQEEEPTATPTPTLSPTPTPEVIQPGRLMLGLSQSMREYGSAEIDMSIVLDVNLNDEQIKMLEDSGYYNDIEIEPVFWLKANGNFASSKDAAMATLNMEQNQSGLVSKWSNSEYMQRNTEGDLLEYYFSAAEGSWVVYNQGDSTTPDLTEWIEIFGVAQVSQLATMTVFEDIAVTEITITIIGETIPADTAASPIIIPPNIEIALPPTLGLLVSLSFRISNASIIRRASTNPGNGTPCLCEAKFKRNPEGIAD